MGGIAAPDAIILASLKTIAAAVSTVFAVALVASPRDRRAALALAAFLGLIAGNQWAEAFRQLVGPDDPAGLSLHRLATVFAALDPLALLYFASVHPKPNRLHAPSVLVPAVVIASALAVLSSRVERAPPVEATLFRWTWVAFTIAAYTLATFEVLRVLLAGTGGPPAAPLFVAFAAVAIPTWARAVDPAWGVWRALPTGGAWDAARHLSWVPAVLLATGILLRAASRRGAAEASRAVRAGVAAGLGLAVVLHADRTIAALSLAGVPTDGEALRVALLVLGLSSADAIRWITFGALASAAVLRHDLLGLTLRARRAAARGLVALAFLVVALAAIAAWSAAVRSGAWHLRAPDALAILIAIALSQAFRGIVDRVAYAVYGVPAPTDAPRATAAYRRAAAAAHATEADLERLRAELGLDARAAAEIHAALDATPLAPSAVLAGRYEVVRLIGRGSMGRAFLARDRHMGRDVVLKEVLTREGEDDGECGGPRSRAARDRRINFGCDPMRSAPVDRSTERTLSAQTA